MSKFKKIIPLFMILVLLLNMAFSSGQFVSKVYATGGTEEPKDEETDEESDDVVAGNIAENIITKIGNEDSAIYSTLIESISYDKQVQYLMTYTILKNAWLSGQGYSSLYQSGNLSSTGANDYVTTNISLGIMEVLEANQTIDTSISDGSKENDAPKTESDVEKAKKELSKKIVDEVILPLYIKKYFIRDRYISQNPTDFSGLNSVYFSYKKGKNWEELNAKYFTSNPGHALVSFATVKDKDFSGADDENVKNNLDKFRKSDGQYHDIYKTLLSNIQTKLTDLIVEKKGKLTEADIKNSVTENILQTQMDKSYRDNKGILFPATMVGVGTYPQAGSGSKEAVLVQIAEGNSKNLSDAISYVKVTELLNELDRGSAYKYKQSFNSGYADSVKSAYDNAKISSSSELTNFLNSDLANAGEAKTVNDEGNKIKALGWLPLLIKIKDDIAKDSDKYNSIIKDFDGGNIETDNKVKFVDGEGYLAGYRPLRINDILNLELKQSQTQKDSWTTRNQTSGSPYLTFDYNNNKNSSVAYATIGRTDNNIGTSIGKYSGMKITDIDTSWDLIKNFKGESTKNITTALSIDNLNTDGYYYPQKAIAYPSSNGEKVANYVKSTTDFTLGIDNYGNIISGNSLTVLIPYWMNSTVYGGSGTSEYNFKKNFVNDTTYFASTPTFHSYASDGDYMNMLNKTTIKPLENGYQLSKVNDITITDLAKLQSILDSKAGTITDVATLVKGKDSASISALALAITQITSPDVEKYNKDFVQSVKDSKELYISASGGGLNGNDSITDEEMLDEFNAKDLLERIKMILDVGFYEVIRLTIASWVVSFYTSTFVNYTMSGIFYTETITESAMWVDIMDSLSRILIGAMFMYLSYLAFVWFRGKATMKNVATQFLMLTLALIIPAYIYSPVINLALNKPVDWIVGTSMEQQSMIDAYLMNEKELREEDALYKMLFGGVDELRDRSEDYLVTLYSSTHIDGFDIYEDTYKVEYEYRDPLFPNANKEWKNRELVKFRVSIFHIFEWVESYYDHEQTLFEWLGSNYSEQYGDIGTYKEFKFNSSVNFDTIDVNIQGRDWTASDVYLELNKQVYGENNDVSPDEIIENITSLSDLSQVFRDERPDSSGEPPTMEVREAMLRDLSLPKEQRIDLFGGDGTTYSPTTEKLFSDFGISLRPTDDIFAVAQIVDDLKPFRNSRDSLLYGDVYDINKQVLDNYINNYSIVRSFISSTDIYTVPEFRMVMLDIWFGINDVMDLEKFPTTYEVSTITTDTYMRLGFIPMSAFTDTTDKTLDNVSKYIALREHPMTLLFMFLPMLLLLTAFGLAYLATFYFLMMLVVTVAFIYNYVIKQNYKSKMGMGAIMIIGSFALVKIGLLTIWKLMGYTMNYSASVGGGEPTYPYVLSHCLIIIVYLWASYKFVFAKVINALKGDLANLGGENFTRAVGKFYGDLKSGNLKSIGQSMFKGGEKAKDVYDNEGNLGKIAGAGLAFTAGAIKGLVNKNKDKLGNSVDTVNEVRKGLMGSSFRHGADLENAVGNIFKGVARIPMGKSVREYNKVEADNGGLTLDQQAELEQKGEIGKIISENENEKVTKIDARSEKSASELAEHLAKKGLVAKADGQFVYFNSTGYDMDKQGVRKYLLGDLMEEKVKDLSDKVDITQSTNTEALPYSLNGNDVFGRAKVDLDVGGKTGLSAVILDDILNSPTIKDNFIVDSTPSRQIDGKYVQGKLSLKAKNSNVDVDSAMEELFRIDKVNRTNVDNERVNGTYTNEVTFDSTSEEERSIVEKYTKNSSIGLQKNKLLYNSMNKDEVKKVDKVIKKLKEHRLKDEESAKSMIASISSNVGLTGSAGFAIDTVDLGLDETARTEALSKGLVDSSVRTKVFGGSNSKQIVENLNEIKSFTQNHSADIQAYKDTKTSLFNNAEQILTSSNGGARGYTTKLIEHMKDNDIDVNFANSMEEKLNILNSKHRSKELSKEEYSSEVEKIYEETKSKLVSENVYDDILVKEVGKLKGLNTQTTEVKKLAKQYQEVKGKIKKTNASPDVVSRIGDETFTRLEDVLSNLKDVKMKEDGTIELVSDVPIDSATSTEVIKMINNMKGKAEVPKESTKPKPNPLNRNKNKNKEENRTESGTNNSDIPDFITNPERSQDE